MKENPSQNFSQKEFFLDDTRVSNANIKNPFVTIVVTNYNYEPYLLDCLRSVARQTYKNFKCIVVDDCSNDSSKNLIDEFINGEEKTGRFTFVSNENNLGQMGSFAEGLKYTEGPYVVCVDADDILLEDFLETHVLAHSQYEPVAFTCSNQFQIDEDNVLLSATFPDHKAKGSVRYVPVRPIHFPFWVWSTTSSMMFRRSVLEIIMPEGTDKYRICADYYICHFANLIGGSLLIPSCHALYRRHGNNNYSKNRILGSGPPIGLAELHPKHHEIRYGIFNHLCRKYKLFSDCLSDPLLIYALARTLSPIELIKSNSKIPSNLSFLKIVLLSFLIRVKGLLRIFRARLKSNFNYDHFLRKDGSDILKFPGE